MSVINQLVGNYRVKYAPAEINQVIEAHSPDQIKAQLATYYKELEGATVKVSTVDGEQVVEFVLPSGQKNV